MSEQKHFSVRAAGAADRDIVIDLARKLWPDHSREEIVAEVDRALSTGQTTLLLAEAGSTVSGFAWVTIRNEYVPGAERLPAGYLEGIYIKDEFRNQGAGRYLVQAAKDRLKNMGCREFISDVEADNGPSLEFHERLGFTTTEKLVFFRMELE